MRVVSVLVSARPDFTEDAARRAREWSDEVIVVSDDGDLADALNRVWPDTPAIKVDDDDYYSSTHGRILSYWKPGHTVWNRARIYDCNGHYLNTIPTLSGAVIPPGVTFTADEHGRIRDSVIAQTKPLVASMGTRKIICPGRWLWSDAPPEDIGCRHSE